MKRWRFIRLGVGHGGWLPSRAKPAPKYNLGAMYELARTCMDSNYQDCAP